MVAKRLLIFLCLLPVVAVAQHYDINDTVTQYPHKGTFYHDKFEGRKTASGEIFDQNGFTAAHWKIKLGTYVLVTNHNTGLQVIVKVNDRCPKRGVFDLSHRAATAIGIRGCQPVSIRLLPSGYEERCLAQDAMFDSVYSRLRPAPQNAEEQQVVEKETSKGNAPAAPAKKVSHDKDCYRLVLGTVPNHGEAYAKTQQVPAHYRERVSVETLDTGELQIYIDLPIRHAQAEELCRALRQKFPDAHLADCE